MHPLYENLLSDSEVFSVTEEIEELSGRLKASRQRVAELEKSFTSASSLNQKNEKVNTKL